MTDLSLFETLKSINLPVAEEQLEVLKNNGARALRFRADGKFRIMFLPDSHYDSTLKKEAAATVRFIREALEREKPDLVILGGDNVRDADVRSYYDLLAPVLEKDIPFTMVFGNHDEGENDGDKRSTLRFLQTVPGCLVYDADPDIHGCANHFLPVLSRDGGAIKWGLWLFDSNNESPHGYDGVRRDQLDWFDSANGAVKSFASRAVPSLAFQHIICQEPTKAVFLRAANKSKCMVDYDDGTASARMMNFARLNGLVFEHAGASYVNDGQWDLLSKSGVKAVFTGHDHNNSFTVDVKGMRAEQCPGYSWCVYGHDLIRGVRVIDLDENSSVYSAHTLFTYDLAREKGSKLPEMTEISAAGFLLRKGVSSAMFAVTGALSKKGAEKPAGKLYPVVPGFTVTAHSGCMGLPDNSTEAMEAGVKAGARIVEFDLNFTADGKPVLSHDAPKGECVPLSEAFEFLRRHPDIKANVDVKTTSFLERVAPLAEEYGVLSQLFYTGIGEDFVDAVKEKSPEIPYYLNTEVKNGKDFKALADKCESLGAIGINIHKRFAGAALSDYFHSRGLLVSVFTVDRPGEIASVLETSPDNITSRRPDLVVARCEMFFRQPN